MIEEIQRKCKWKKCENTVETMPGHREKVFCSRLCKQKQWQKDHAKGSEYVHIPKEEYEEMIKIINRRTRNKK